MMSYSVKIECNLLAATVKELERKRKVLHWASVGEKTLFKRYVNLARLAGIHK